jgi:hypothetical protein
MSHGADAASRLQFLHEVAELLWPAPATLTLARPRERADERTVSEYILVAGRNRPRLLVPATDRRAAAAAVRGYGEQVGLRAKAVNWLTAAGLRTGADRWLGLDRVRVGAGSGTGARDDIETHLAEVLQTEVSVSMHLSAARANRKPVLQVLGRGGRTLAFVKVGVDELTRRLVDHEATALLDLAARDLRLLQAPEVRSVHRWRGLALLVLSPLPVHARRVADDGRRTAALLELIATGREDFPLVQSSWWDELHCRQSTLDQSAAASRLRAVTGELERVGGKEVLAFGPAHGDWTSWNTAATATSVLAWDWERFAPSVPVGYDALHRDLQDRVVLDGQPLAEATRAVLDTAPEVLRPFDVEARRARLVAGLYLADICCRYLSERQAEAGAMVGRVQDWLLPAIEAHAARMSGT